MDINKISEDELLAQCLAHNRRYQEILYRKYASDMYAVSLMYMRNPADAQDILQNAFIRVFQNLSHFEKKGPLRAWIRRIVVNASIDFYKSKKRDSEVFAGLPPEEERMLNSVSVNQILGHLNYNDIIKLVNQLPERAQLVLKLYAIEGYKHQEIADMMGINEGTSKSQLNRAKKLLKEALQQHAPGYETI